MSAPVAARFNPRSRKPQTVKTYGGEVLTITYAGRCLSCNSTVYDGSSSPLGPTTGRHYNDGMTRPDGSEAPACFDCCNDGERYARMRSQLGWKD